MSVPRVSFNGVSERCCHRCGSVLHTEDQGSLVYCWHCGAPQVTLSEDLQEQAAQLERGREEAERQASAASIPLSGALDWKRAIALSAVVAGAMSLLVTLLPPMALLSLVWAPMTPAIVMTLYSARGRHARITAGTGARLGAVCGLFLIAGLALVNALELVVIRFAVHGAQGLDTTFDAMLAQLRSQAAAQPGQPALDMFTLLNVPEFRAGFFLTGLALVSGILLLLTVAGGAFAGALRARRRAA